MVKKIFERNERMVADETGTECFRYCIECFKKLKCLARGSCLAAVHPRQHFDVVCVTIYYLVIVCGGSCLAAVHPPNGK